MKRLCAWCEEVEVKKPYWSCEDCASNRQVNTSHKDLPEKGDKRYYDEKWYMKNTKTLNEEIRSRRTTDGGKTVFRVDSRGNRIT